MLWKLFIITMCCFIPLSSYADTQSFVLGRYSSDTHQFFPLLASSNPTATIWNYKTLPDLSSHLPNNSFSNYLVKINCNAHLCVSIGGYGTIEGDHPLLLTSFDQGNEWRSIPLSSEKNDDISLYNVNCNNDLCVFVGEHRQQKTNKFLPFLGTTQGTQWDMPLSVIVNLPSNVTNGNFFDVTCNNSFCVAVGYYLTDKSTFPLVAVSNDKNKTQWNYSRSIESNLPKNVVRTTTRNIYCNDKVCIIPGSYKLSSGNEMPLLATSYDQGKTWDYPTDIISKLPTTTQSTLNKVKCVDDFCIAIGNYRPDQTDPKNKNLYSYPLMAISHDAGKTWSYNTHLNIKLPDDSISAEFQDVSCNQKLCLAAGKYSIHTLNDEQPLLIYSKDQGNTWFMQHDLPKDYGQWGDLSSVSCSDLACFAAGSYISTAKRFIPLLITTQEGNSWWYPDSVINNLPQHFLYGALNYTYTR